jgi:uncharacterized protein (TIGR00299 family) protein
MHTLVVDCPTGLAGDMLLAASLDLGVPRQVITEPLAALGFGDAYRLVVEESTNGGLRGLQLDVEPTSPCSHHRHWRDLRGQITAAPIAPLLKQRVLAVFGALAEAEAAVHGTSPDKVHFHEVGAIDSLVDVVGVCAAITHLAPQRLLCQPPPAGRGTVETAHGCLPVPVPAVLELARCHRVPLRSGPHLPGGELTTPTGLALMAVLADAFAEPQDLVVDGVGIGLGHRQLDRPNLLRLMQVQEMPRGDEAIGWQELVVQEAWIDDASAEDIAHLAESLRQAGALEVVTTPALMQKGRQGHALTALVLPDQALAVRDVWLRTSSSLGVRERRQGRWLLWRRSGLCPSPWGDIRVKQVRRPGGHTTLKVEHDELRRISFQESVSVDHVRQVVLAEADRFTPLDDWSL